MTEKKKTAAVLSSYKKGGNQKAMSDKNKLNGAGPDTGAAPDTSTGTAADVDEIMKKYDRESNTRVFEGVPRVVIKYLLG